MFGLTSISFGISALILIFDTDFSKEVSFTLVVLLLFFKFLFPQISTLSSEKRGVKKINKISERKNFLFEFNDFFFIWKFFIFV